MANNQKSYTYQKYLGNKGLFRFQDKLTWLGGIAVLFVLILNFKGMVSIFSTNPLLGGFLILCIIGSFNFLSFIFKEVSTIRRENYRTWGRGAGGELSVLQSLEKLPSVYKIISDYNTGHGNIDHIVIGPTGIFTVEVKASEGKVSFYNDMLYINGQEIGNDYLKQAYAEERTLEETIRQKTGKHYPVTGILIFPFARIDRSTIHGKVHGIWVGGYGFQNWVIRNKGMFGLSSEETIFLEQALQNKYS